MGVLAKAGLRQGGTQGAQRCGEAAGPRCRGARGGLRAPDPALRCRAGLLRQSVLALQRHGTVCQAASMKLATLDVLQSVTPPFLGRRGLCMTQLIGSRSEVELATLCSNPLV